MDPDAKVQVATLGTALYYTVNLNNQSIDQWTIPTNNTTGEIENMVRVYGLASTPDFGGEPNTIDSTTLDNTEYETNVLGLQPSNVLSYEINVMDFTVNTQANHNLYLINNLVTNKTLARWVVDKASGVRLYYDAITKIQYNADEQSAIEKFTIFHSLKSKIKVSIPTPQANS